MCVFVPVSPFSDISFNSFSLGSNKQLFLIGGIAIAVGVFTYSKKVMFTVGYEMMKLNPSAASIIVISHSIILFLTLSRAPALGGVCPGLGRSLRVRLLLWRFNRVFVY